MKERVSYDQDFRPIAQHMRVWGLSETAIKAFNYYYSELLKGSTGMIPGSEILSASNIPDLEEMSDVSADIKDEISRLVVIKLNGGLGTSMGLDRAKSLLPAKEKLSFLDIIIKQIIQLRKECGKPVPLIFMNSFRTQEDTLAALAYYPEFEEGQGEISCSFIQNKVPKICQKTLQPLTWLKDPSLEWCPPGHGDIYTCLSEFALLDDLIDAGYRYAFISNSDNLGATVDEKILAYLAKNNIPFLMEVADRTEADKKGGHLALSASGRLLLRESSQCPKEEEGDFQNIEKYRYFNTNSIWVNLQALQTALKQSGGFLKLPLIRNSKNIDPSDSSSPKVYQLETAMGAAISSFEGACAVRVPRSRFMPVKKTEDLIALWSDIFLLEDSGKLKINPNRNLGTVLVELDPAYYAQVGHFQARFPEGAPSLLNCSSLRIKGDVRFGRDVTLIGDVNIENKQEEQMYIESGTQLKGKFVAP